MTVTGRNGTRYTLPEQPFAGGGEGHIYDVAENKDIVVKLYHKQTLLTSEREKKLLYMANNPPAADSLDQIAWPMDVVYRGGVFAGFVMRRFRKNVDMNVIWEYGADAKYPDIPWRNFIMIAKNLCAVLDAVHAAGHVCGDLNPRNVSVDPATGHVVFWDTDSYHITDGKETYRCGVGVPEYLAPELQPKLKLGLGNAPLPTFTQATDRFALAVNIFQLLMNGAHPFACAAATPGSADDVVDVRGAIERSECTFFGQVPGKKPPAFAPDTGILPAEVQALFRRAFTDPSAPQNRPSASEWYYALGKIDLKNGLVKCKKVSYHEYPHGLHACPWCAADARYSGVMQGHSLTQTTYTYKPRKASSAGPVSAVLSAGKRGLGLLGAFFAKLRANKALAAGAVALLGLIAGLLLYGLFSGGGGLSVGKPGDPGQPSGVAGQIMGVYTVSSGGKDVIVTVTDCTPDGSVSALWEFINNNTYGRVSLTGQVEKTAFGKITVGWISQTPEILPEGTQWRNEHKAVFSKKGQRLKTDTLTLVAGEDDSRNIRTAADLQKLSGGDGLFVLQNDIDLSDVEWTPLPAFSGTLVGNGHAIRNLYIEAAADDTGFFTELSGFVSDVTFENARVTVAGYRKNVGVICGRLTGGLKGCAATGAVEAPDCENVGGLAGCVDVRDAKAFYGLENGADITAKENGGGVFGYVYTGDLMLSECRSTGGVSVSGSGAGGIAGYAEAGYFDYKRHLLTVTDCENTGSVLAGLYAGGLFGTVSGSESGSAVERCVCAGSVSAQAYAGGIAGRALNTRISGCKNTGAQVSATAYVIEDNVKYACLGGFAGYGYTFSDCENNAALSYGGEGRYVGGIAGCVNLADGAQCSGLKNAAPVRGADYVGGLFGYFYAGDITMNGLENTGAVTASGDYAGGTFGCLEAGYFNYKRHTLRITDAVNTGEVRGGLYTGGLFGLVSASDASSAAERCRCAAAVTGEAYVGCIAGKAEQISLVRCENAGSAVSAAGYVIEDNVKCAYLGGFAGAGYLFTDCVNETDVFYAGGGRYVGGVAGFVQCLDTAEYKDLGNKAAVAGAEYVGGVFGYLYAGDVQFTALSNAGDVRARGYYAGGIAGYAQAGYFNYKRHSLHMIDSANTGEVRALGYAGGLFGAAVASNADSALIDCTSAGAVSGGANTGALAGVLENIEVRE